MQLILLFEGVMLLNRLSYKMELSPFEGEAQLLLSCVSPGHRVIISCAGLQGSEKPITRCYSSGPFHLSRGIWKRERTWGRGGEGWRKLNES